MVCKNCGSEVSPYITECPYCGHRLRRRAPKLPRERGPRKVRTRGPRTAALLRRAHLPGSSSLLGASYGTPWTTLALVAAGAGVWVAMRGGFIGGVWLVGHQDFVEGGKWMILGPLHGEWWRLLTFQFISMSAPFAFVTLASVGLFGWLLERRHGPLPVLALFVASGAAAGLAAEAIYPYAIVSGANAAALALLGAWAAADLMCARSGEWYDGDLLGTGAIAAVLLVSPFAVSNTSWLAGVIGGVMGLVVGVGLARMAQASEL